MSYNPPPSGTRPGGVPPPNVRYRVPVQPGPPIPPRQRPPSRSPVIAPILALLGLFIIGGASLWGISLLSIEAAEPEIGDTTNVSAPGTVTAAVPVAASTRTSLPTGVLDEIFGQTTEGAPLDGAPAVSENLVRPPEGLRPNVKGSILFARDRDIWVASGQNIDQLSSNRTDSSPTWSHDGRHIYFVRTKQRQTTRAREAGKYTFYIGDVMRMNGNGGDKKDIYKSIINQPNALWFSHVLQPAISPDGKTLAVVSDGPDGSGPVVLHTLSAKEGGSLRATQPRSVGELGHNDPEWSPDGKSIAFTQNQARGSTGVPRIVIYRCRTRKNCTAGKVKPLKNNYANPSWSPDSKWLAVERTDGTGRDIAIVGARLGDEKARLTNDGDSFAPVVSPDGDQIAYLHRDGVNIDVRIMTLDLSSGGITLVEDVPITTDGGIDPSSTPAWFIPKDQLTPRVEEADAIEAADGVAPDVATTADEQTLGAVTP
jgi:Tol biopolymer transport system component